MMSDVVTDSVPSPARPFQTPCKPRPNSPAVVPDKPDCGDDPININIGASAADTPSRTRPKLSLIPDNCDPEDDPIEVNIGASSSHKSSRKAKTTKRGKGTCLIFNNANNITVGNVITTTVVNNNQIYGKSTEERSEKKKLAENDQMLLSDLVNTLKPVDTDDLLMVSQCLNFAGIKILARKLDVMDKLSELERIHKSDIKEMCYLMLQYWTDICQRRPGNGAGLNILSKSLKSACDNGGLKAIRALHKRHYPSS